LFSIIFLLTNTKDYNKRYFYGTYVSNSYIRRLYCIRVSFGVDANSNLRTSWGPSSAQELAEHTAIPVHLPRVVIYHAPTNPKPEQGLHRMQEGGNCRPGCCGEVRSGATLLGWSGEGVPGADCICRAGSDVDCDCDCGVCDMENPLSRSEFLLKNLHTLSSARRTPRSLI